MPDGSVTGWPRRLLRLEGGLLLAASAAAYGALGHSWPLFAVALLLPDVGIAGYLGGSRVGAAVYNAFHTELAPAALACIAWAAEGGPAAATATAVALAWLAHIGMDRMLGYGLKHASGFRHTHLGAIGRPGHP